ncbi:uncharacterized protein LOC119188610 [Manduca sexta]|uniref:uncharacterized protein LOC119188610 n=1 Tax=Manduca sexta TaxID=7130 RepID=UPI0018905338|nr:uncharacterized protein LOC119188610 [Manduca sexta]
MYTFILLGLLFIEAESYVLLQVRKQDNNYSNVDALIHKVVPSDKFDKIASKFGAKNTDLKPIEKKEKEREAKTVASIEKTILKFTKKDKPMFRAQNQYIQPKVINFRNSKPSLVFEINSKAIVSTIKDLLSSKTFQTYFDKFAKKAAIIYRSIKDDIDKEYY